MKTKTQSTPEQVTQRYMDAYYILYSKRMVSNKREFCDLTNLLSQNFSAIEQGKRLASMAQICALITNLNINPTWLMTGQGEMFA